MSKATARIPPKKKQSPEPVAHVPETAKPEERQAGGNAHWQTSLAIAAGWFIVDHATKFWAEKALKPDWWGVMAPTARMIEQAPAIQIVPGCLRFVYAENRGAAFSMFDGHTFALGIVSLVASALLFWFWRSLPADEKWGRAAVALVFSGAIGNMIDRFFRGFVVDFIDAYIGQHHWPTFNIADSCICVGVAILILRFLKGKI